MDIKRAKQIYVNNSLLYSYNDLISLFIYLFTSFVPAKFYILISI